MTVDLTEARLNRGYSIRKLSDELGIHQHTIRRLERGEHIRPSSAKKIADWLSTDNETVRVTDLMAREAA